MNDRIKLAEAMGRPYKSHDGTTAPNVFQYFDPFTDANDDYAVLEWMRSRQPNKLASPIVIMSVCEWVETWKEWDAFYNALPECLADDYEIGDYARAALKVIE